MMNPESFQPSSAGRLIRAGEGEAAYWELCASWENLLTGESSPGDPSICSFFGNAMKYEPDRHHRRSIRLRNRDYASAGAYFVTICVQGRACVLGEIVDGAMQLSAWGRIVTYYWQTLPRHFPGIKLDAFVVMPNHVHFILWLNPPDDVVEAQFVGAQFVGAQFNCAPTAPSHTQNTATSPIGKQFTVDKQRPTLGQVVRAFKAATTRLIRQAAGVAFGWQRNYYEHVVRDEAELHRIRQYILDNPVNWARDRENPDDRQVP